MCAVGIPSILRIESTRNQTYHKPNQTPRPPRHARCGRITPCATAVRGKGYTMCQHDTCVPTAMRVSRRVSCAACDMYIYYNPRPQPSMEYMCTSVLLPEC